MLSDKVPLVSEAEESVANVTSDRSQPVVMFAQIAHGRLWPASHWNNSDANVL
jgi:hypothetical protein